MNGVSGVYGQALYDLAKDEDLAEGIGAELVEIRKILLGNPDFIRLISSPGIPKAERLGIIDEAFRSSVHPYTLNFMKILTEKGYIQAFPACCDVYRSCYNADHNILPVVATTALPLNELQAAKLRRRLSAITGRQIELENRIDPACMGGVRLDYDGKRVDDTVAGRIERLHSMLKNTAL